jgi:membrane-bound ClpP family serine protease
MNANRCVEITLDTFAESVGQHLDATPLAIVGPIFGDLDLRVREAVESIDPSKKKPKVAIILDTGGGVVELVERMVGILRHHFAELHFVIPDRAMSAGTIFAMSGDVIWMDYFACLGPIDPQIERDGKLVPALSYVVQFEELVAKSRAGLVSPAELLLLQKLDLADLHVYQQARDLSVSLLVEWLSNYKFKDWTMTAGQGLVVDEAMKKKRAEEIARALSDNVRWKSHGRPISMRVLTDQLNLRINDLAANPPLHEAVQLYYALLMDYVTKTGRAQAVHTPGHCG